MYLNMCVLPFQKVDQEFVLIYLRLAIKIWKFQKKMGVQADWFHFCILQELIFQEFDHPIILSEDDLHRGPHSKNKHQWAQESYIQ